MSIQPESKGTLREKGMHGKVLAVIQARTGSERLPGKVLLSLADRPVIEHVVRAVSAAESVDEVVVATTKHGSDDKLADLASDLGVRTFRGAENDVLSRFVGAVGNSSAETIIRFTADDPLLDPDIIDRVVARFKKSDADYVSNIMERSWPRGMDTEVFSRAALLKSDHEGNLPEHREHVTIYVRTHPDLFKIENVLAPPEETWAELRLCVDTAKDYKMLQMVFDAIYTGDRPLRIGEVIFWLNQNPEVVLMNAAVEQKTVFGRQF